MTYALTRPARLDVGGFARATGLHPDLVRRFVDLGLLDAVPGSTGEPSFATDQVPAAARLLRLRAGFALNYAALALVADLLDRIAELEAAARPRRAGPRGGSPWT